MIWLLLQGIVLALPWTIVLIVLVTVMSLWA